MEYRKLPKGSENEKFSAIGLGLGGINANTDKELEDIFIKAIDAGINFFDLCTAKNVFAPLGKAIKGRREKVFLQMHFGAVYNDDGEYGWSRDYNVIKNTFEWELKELGTTYTDMGYLHCVDEDEDFENLRKSGVLDLLKELKEKGVVRHIGFSSHTPSVANKIIDTGLVDMMMFSINVAYDFEKGDEYGIGSYKERTELFKRCQREGIGISAMKPFHAGKLLLAHESPFKVALTHEQCLKYVLDRPGVLVVVPGIRNMADLDVILNYQKASESALDYSVVGSFSVENVYGTCLYCNHCRPCPVGIDVGLVNKYYDLAKAGDALAANHYEKLTLKADDCIACGHCDSRCPFKVEQSKRMKEIAEYFNT